MNFITIVRRACNEYKTRQRYFTRPFSPPQALKGPACQTKGGGEMSRGSGPHLFEMIFKIAPSKWDPPPPPPWKNNRLDPSLLRQDPASCITVKVLQLPR